MKLKMVGIFLCGLLRGVARFSPVSYVSSRALSLAPALRIFAPPGVGRRSKHDAQFPIQDHHLDTFFRTDY